MVTKFFSIYIFITWVLSKQQWISRFDISIPAWGFLQQFYNPVVGGFGTSGRYAVPPTESTEPLAMVTNPRKYDVGIFMTAHLALAALFFGGQWFLIRPLSPCGHCIRGSLPAPGKTRNFMKAHLLIDALFFGDQFLLLKFVLLL